MSALRHKVELDRTGSGHERYTCRSEGCSEATVVRQPYMNNSSWKAAADSFLKSHPCRKVSSGLPKDLLTATH